MYARIFVDVHVLAKLLHFDSQTLYTVLYVSTYVYVLYRVCVLCTYSVYHTCVDPLQSGTFRSRFLVLFSLPRSAQCVHVSDTLHGGLICLNFCYRHQARLKEALTLDQQEPEEVHTPAVTPCSVLTTICVMQFRVFCTEDMYVCMYIVLTYNICVCAVEFEQGHHYSNNSFQKLIFPTSNLHASVFISHTCPQIRISLVRLTDSCTYSMYVRG